jgi:hypothetical protein
MSGFSGRLGPFTLVPATTIPSAVAQIDIPIPTGLRRVQLWLASFDPATTNTDLQMLFSTDGGSTFDTTVGDYRWMQSYISSGSGSGGMASGGVGALPVLARAQMASYTFGALIDLFPTSNAGDYQPWNWSATYRDNTAGDYLHIAGGGLYLISTPITNARFRYAPSVNIANGTYGAVGFP